MRIVVVGSAPGLGLLYYPTRMAIEMSRLGNEVHLVTYGETEQSPGLARRAEERQIKVHRVGCLEVGGCSALCRSNRELKRLVYNIRPDVVHTYGPVGAVQCRPFYRRPSWRQVVMVEAMGHAHNRYWPLRAGAMLLNRFADRVVAICEAEVRRLERAGVRREKIRLVYNPMDCDDFVLRAGSAMEARNTLLKNRGLSEECRLCGCFASFQPRKRQDLLINAFADIAEGFPNWHLVLGGRGEQQPHCEDLASRRGVKSRVHFLGQLTNAEVVPVLAAMDAVVHCSTAETFGYSMVEPLLFGIPTLVTRIAIGCEMERAGVASVVTPAQPGELRDGLERVFAGNETVIKMAAEGPRWVRANFDLPVVVRKMLTVYSE